MRDRLAGRLNVSEYAGHGIEFSFFFFSSRRRHTRFDCDWSSDVCSSDLENDNLFLKPDYTIENAELWKRVAVKVMTNAHDLSLLSSVQYQTEKLESEDCSGTHSSYRWSFQDTPTNGALPSWIPQWNHVFRATLSPWDSEDKFSAAKSLPLTFGKPPDSDSLLVQGLEIGMIGHTLSFMWHDVDVSLL